MKNKRAKQENQLRPHRFAAIVMLFFLITAVFLARLVQMQLTDYDGNYSLHRLAAGTRYVTVKAVRGMICDRNGKVLVSTEEIYHLETNGLLPRDDALRNQTLRDVLALMERCGTPRAFSATYLPYTLENGTVIPATLNEKQAEYLEKFLADTKIADRFDSSFLYQLCRYYEIVDEQTDVGAADWAALYELAQLRYDIDAYHAQGKPFRLAANCEMQLVTALKERGTEGVGFSTEQVRVYHYPGYLSQILGRIGKIQEQDVEYYTALGYPMDAVVGVDGLEKVFETTLCGTDGQMLVTEDADGNILKTETTQEPVAGNNVYLTIDIDLQIIAEDRLKANIEQVAAAGAASPEEYDGEDAAAGALCAVNPQDGSILAMASYPTYDMTTFSRDYAALASNEKKPLLNRVLQGQYEPGSTFKPAVAAAALENSVIDENTVIRDEGVYKYYEDFQPACWIYNRFPGSTHGDENVVEALVDSCNYFFYETGRQMGIDKMNGYISRLGLGQATGVELFERTGTLAGPEERNEKGERWNPGDTLQAAIGQSDNLFTPLQMCMYLSTLTNGGTRYQAHLYAKTTPFDSDEVLNAYTPTVLDTVPLSEKTSSLIKGAMGRVSTAVFTDTSYTVGAKTGTAQVSKTGSDNALYEAFAPLEKPEIVAFAVIENGSSGSNAGRCVKDLFDAYFAGKAQG